MRFILKTSKILLLVIASTAFVAAALFVSVRAYRQHANASQFEIRTPKGVDESGYVRIGGIDQWIQVRGQNRENPILLCVHGGPGGTWLPVTRLFLPWEKEFTVVFWDQRGAGKSLKATGPEIASTMSVERMTQDGIEVADYLRTRFKKEKVILLGHSFGSVLGAKMAKRRPDLFYAFVGTGQVSDLPKSVAGEYNRVLLRARFNHDMDTVRSLSVIGPPPFKNLKQVATYFEQTGKYQAAGDNAALGAMQQSLLSPPPNYSLRDELSRLRGFMAVPPWTLYKELLNTRLTELGSDFALPVIIIQGEDDFVTPAKDAREYLEVISAPRKDFVVIPGGGHFAVWSHANLFLGEMIARVRPLAP